MLNDFLSFQLILMSHHSLSYRMTCGSFIAYICHAVLPCVDVVQLSTLGSLASFLATPKVQLGVGADPHGWITVCLSVTLQPGSARLLVDDFLASVCTE